MTKNKYKRQKKLTCLIECVETRLVLLTKDRQLIDKLPLLNIRLLRKQGNSRLKLLKADRHSKKREPSYVQKLSRST